MGDATSVLDTLDAQLGTDTLEKLSAQLGSDTAAISNAIAIAIPILLGGLAKNAADADGAAALDAALSAHGGILDDSTALLGSGGSGAAILPHILGSRRGPIEQGLVRATGLNATQVGGFLMMLAPLVMGVLGRMRRDQSVNAEQLPVVLGQASLDMARQSPAAGDLSRILAGDDDGAIADDVARIGSTVVGGMLGETASS